VTIKGLTISEPWATKIAGGEKFVENRSWFTSYRGWLAIQSGQGSQYLTRAELRAYPVGHIIAVTRLTACVSIADVRYQAKYKISAQDFVPGTKRTWGEVSAHEFTEGPCCLILENTFKLPEPVRFKGSLGLWSIPDDVVAILRAQHKPEAIS
jgi:hypothetical protein